MIFDQGSQGLGSTVLIANGIYDLICSLCALFFPLFSPHLKMLVRDDQDPAVQRLMAYWIFTYGTVRLVVGVQGYCMPVAALTYFVEALCVAHEGFCGSMVAWKSAFVALFSVVLGFVFLRLIEN